MNEEPMFPMPDLDPDLSVGLDPPRPPAVPWVPLFVVAGLLLAAIVLGGAAVISPYWSLGLAFVLVTIAILNGRARDRWFEKYTASVAARLGEVEMPPCTCGIGDGETTSSTAACPRHGHCRGCRQPVGEKHAVACPVYERVTSTNQPPAVDYGDVFEKPREAAEAARITRRDESRPA